MAEQNTQTANAPQTNEGGNGNSTKNEGKQTTYTQEQLDSMVSAREGRAANAALKSFFEQQGMSEDEIKQAIATYKENRKKNEPDAATLTAQNEEYRKEALLAKIESKATIEALNLGVDMAALPHVLKLADFSDVADDKGAISATKLKDAISKVLTDVPQFKKQTEAATGFQKIGADGSPKQGGTELDALRKAFGLKPKN